MLTPEQFMLEAIELSRNGFPAPNPHVGCVIVNDDHVVGRGFCRRHGADHAEQMALKDAGDQAKGATAYVSLEPCNHFGKTPPCSHALVQQGIAKVVYAIGDPNPVAAGGAKYLLENGIEVQSGLMAKQAASANAQFLFAMRHQRPLVTVKAGMTLDAKVALLNGESKWITNEASRQDAMKLRADIGCVMVGRVTAELDQSRLNVRGLDDVNQPLRVALDPRSVLDKSLPIFDKSAPTLHLTGPTNPTDILQRIWDEKRTGVLIEGGPTTNAHFFQAGLVDQIVLYVAPKVFGEGKSWIGTFGLQNIEASPSLELVETKIIEGDIKIVYRSRNLQSFLASYNM
jgi:diaminohydroxyphosphoribosylaminopyrimidine deaminase / 5-amino-6-(5-phosphoribosylamino)uracil reductase